MPTGTEIDAAVARGIAYLERVQLPSGELPVFATTDPTLQRDAALDPSIFPTALAAHCLSFCPAAALLRERAHDFLLSEMDRHGLWRHWTREHPHYRSLPPDLDDTSCASAVLVRAGRAIPGNHALLLANRDRRGRFFTWVVPRPRWTGLRHMKLVLAQLRHAPTLAMFFRLTSAKPYDVDACVNASTLFYLGRFPGSEKVVQFLCDCLEAKAERQSDKWYENPFVVRYFLSRALASAGAPARSLVVGRTAAEARTSSLEHALAAAALLDWHEDAGADIAALLAGQSADGSWRRAAVYHGGRARLRAGGFAEPHPDTPRWGSEAITTAFAIEALSRWQARQARQAA
jgi:hypothetical protein